ncbi:hypothetical protein B0H16DRAFT_1495004 [Mycena metata]|uniref:Uncharacterized protein n=1 Tax=Mycena metata TaxID=1033252 RepID=A0AAD7KCN8_9AGAR|nr:hypothetical protein B0H16DRAFT_1495004 [Mycena metata]
MWTLDRLAVHTQAIQAAASCAPPPGPFTRAATSSAKSSPAELGLFTPQLARAEFHGPAPRRKQDPEVYAQAAFTYIDRYNTVRPMPRAYAQVVAILEQLTATRENIRALTTALEQIQPSELKPLADQEEQRVQELQAKLADLKQRKAAATVQPKPRKRPKPAVPPPPATPVSSKLDDSFHTPARTLRFTDNLMDEQVDLADISITSPAPPARVQERASPPDASQEENREETVDKSVIESEETADESAAEEDTIVLPKPVATPSPPPSPVQPSTAGTPRKGKVRINTEVERIVVCVALTTEDRLTVAQAKIWSSAGDLIMPGHSFDTSGTGAGNKPPRAKETMQVLSSNIPRSAHLQSVAALVPTPASPSTSISSLTAPVPAAPTPQQILTAHLAPRTPQHGAAVKEVLAAKASTSGGAGIVLGGQSTTRVLYGCVAKRLVKIERGGGEQVVKFDT